MASPTNGFEFEKALGVGEGQGSLMCYSPWGHKELDMTQRRNKRAAETCSENPQSIQHLPDGAVIVYKNNLPTENMTQPLNNNNFELIFT